MLLLDIKKNLKSILMFTLQLIIYICDSSSNKNEHPSELTRVKVGAITFIYFVEQLSKWLVNAPQRYAIYMKRLYVLSLGVLTICSTTIIGENSLVKLILYREISCFRKPVNYLRNCLRETRNNLKFFFIYLFWHLLMSDFFNSIERGPIVPLVPDPVGSGSRKGFHL